MDEFLFQPSIQQHSVDGIGSFVFRPLSFEEDIPLVHAWVTQPYAKFWGMQNFTLEQVKQEYRRLCEYSWIYIGERNGRADFLVEVYHPKDDIVGKHYAIKSGDCGMHILVAPTDTPISGFTWAAFQSVMHFVFSDTQMKRVVVEPDSSNEKIHALNARAGFEFHKLLELPHKQARLEFCTRQQFLNALEKEKLRMPKNTATVTNDLSNPQYAVNHLTPSTWEKVNRLLIRKALSEFIHERILTPILIGESERGCDYEVQCDEPHIVYRFRTRHLALNHWLIDSLSIKKFVNENEQTLDAVLFVTEVQKQLGIPTDLLPTYLEEVCSTLYGSAFKHQRAGQSVEQLVSADFQTIEAAMMEGHPCFIANNGRIGFGADDYREFAPESGQAVKLIWLAVHKSHTVFACASDLDYQTLMSSELNAAQQKSFHQTLEENALNPEDFYFLPVHPWQWHNKLVYLFACDIATQNIICLGCSDDHYQAQQSIRTFFNVSSPQKRYVKTSLSILNMGFMRGLSPYYMSTTPAINDWLNNLIEHDPYLSQSGFCILREVAAIGYKNHRLEQATDKGSAYRKMLSALWRESPLARITDKEKLMTMASLLHIDADGNALLPALIQSSGKSIDEWLSIYLDSYLSPLLHCFYMYDLVFMPHGENIILVMENNVPVRVIMKDIAEECAIMNKDVVLSDNIQRLAIDVPEDIKILSIFTDVFDCFFRFLSATLVEHSNYSEQQFWSQVAQCIHRYQDSHPELNEKFQRYDLFTNEFTLSCLNRLQLNNNQQMIDLADPAKNLQFQGMLQNPIATFKSNTKINEYEKSY